MIKYVIFLLIPIFCNASTQIAIVGDSISSVNCAIVDYKNCYPSLLENELKKDGYDVEIINVSVGGTNTYGSIDILTYLFRYHHPDIILLEFGLNDILRKVPIEVTRDNFNKMISVCISHKCKILLANIDVYSWYPQISLNYISKFNAIFTDLEKAYPGILFNFLDTEMLISPLYNLGDKCHPNANGHRKICDELKKHLIPIMEIY